MNSALLTVALTIIPSVTWACAVCVGGNEENRQAFIFTTILLTIVPLVIIGGAVRWIQKRTAERDAQLEATEQELR